MSKSEMARAMDEVQGALRSELKEAGFRKHGRSYNRVTSEGLTHVIGFQMGAFDPPGTTYIPGFTEDFYGRFWVNIGVYVPEVAHYRDGAEVRNVVRDYDCCIRTCLWRRAIRDTWWPISTDNEVIAELKEQLMGEALPFLRRYEKRDQILKDFIKEADNTETMDVPRIVCAMILLKRGEREAARSLLAAQAREHTRNPGHPEYVAGLARKLGIDIARS